MQWKTSSVKSGKNETFRNCEANASKLYKNLELYSNEAKQHEGKPGLPVPTQCPPVVQFLSSVLLQYLLEILQPHLKCSSCEKLCIGLAYFEQSFLVQEGNHDVVPTDRSPGAGEVALAHLGCFLPLSLSADPMTYFPLALHTRNLIYR